MHRNILKRIQLNVVYGILDFESHSKMDTLKSTKCMYFVICVNVFTYNLLCNSCFQLV